MQLPCNLDAGSLLEHLREAVVIVDDDSHVQYANGAAERLFARSTEGLLGHRLDPRAADTGKVVIHRGEAGDAYAEATSLPFDWHGRSGRLLLLHDVTELVHKQDRLRKALKMEAVGRLTAGVAHDFNNKLTIIGGFTRVALSQVSANDGLHESLQEIERAASHSAKMIAQLLTLSRPQSPDQKPSRLNHLIESMLPSLERLAGAQVQLNTTLAGDVGSVRLDPVQLEQAVTNLATNARDAMEGHGQLALTTANVHISEAEATEHGAAPGDHVVLSVTDNGCGMDDAVRKQIFEPFFTTKPNGQGTGLGMAMVYGFVVGNDGHIRLDSAPGQGTTFHLYFPRVADADEPAPPAPATTGSYQSDSSNGEVILVAEDEPAVRNLLIRVLQTCGYQVIAGSDGAEALRKAENFDGAMDLVITDVVMPNMCGRTLAEAFRKTHPTTPVVYISGYAQGIIDEEIAEREHATLVRKPFSPDHLQTVVRQSLQRSIPAPTTANH